MGAQRLRGVRCSAPLAGLGPMPGGQAVRGEGRTARADDGRGHTGEAEAARADGRAPELSDTAQPDDGRGDPLAQLMALLLPAGGGGATQAEPAAGAGGAMPSLPEAGAKPAADRPDAGPACGRLAVSPTAATAAAPDDPAAAAPPDDPAAAAAQLRALLQLRADLVELCCCPITQARERLCCAGLSPVARAGSPAQARVLVS